MGEHNGIETDLILLIFEESTSKGQNLFDSRKIAKNKESNGTSNGKGRAGGGGEASMSLICEMMFGAIPLAQQGSNTKIHLLRGHEQILISKVFGLRFNPVLSTPSSNNVDIIGSYKGESHHSTERWKVSSSTLMHSLQMIRKTFGIGLLFSKSNSLLSKWISSHFLLLDYHLRVLMKVVIQQIEETFHQERAALNARSSKSMASPTSLSSLKISLAENEEVIAAVESFTSCLSSLLKRARSPLPMYLLMQMYPTKQKTICEKFFSLLSQSSRLDHLRSNFLLSTALTAILSCHLTWVVSVRNRTEEMDGKWPWLDLVLTSLSNTTHPLCTQLNLLLGNLASSNSKSRTFTRVIVVGKHKETVTSLLQVLSYFIRTCPIFSQQFRGEINEQSIENEEQSLGTARGNTTPPPDTSLNRGASFTKLMMVGLLSKSKDEMNQSFSSDEMDSSFVNSMFCSYCDEYQKDSLLMGLPTFNFISQLSEDLKSLVEGTSLIEGQPNFTQASCLVVDTKDCCCEIYKYQKHQEETVAAKDIYHGLQRERLYPSDYISATICSSLDMIGLGLPPDAAMSYLEDRLAGILSKSLLLGQYFNYKPDINETDEPFLIQMLGIAASDLNLIVTVWKSLSTYFPFIVQ
eukprot:TRINITY_DN8725_c0_g1_i2.p1 TRINITY_DN8725_c0_g1~~TRINITY_DN8725_c0_g1_i2.p1  ORF type:complete len:634 (-),score=175.40 TRINITY_DN8725_c0_g1_i2:28-1929(-)